MTATNTNRSVRRRRGLLDFVLLVGLGYGVYAATPIGAVVETAVRVAQGQRDHPSWFATFRGRELSTGSDDKVEAIAAAVASGGVPAPVALAARGANVSVDAVAAVVAAAGSCDELRCTVRAPDHLAMYSPGAAGDVDERIIALSIKNAREALQTQSDALAIEALYLGTPAIELARAQARNSGLEAPDDVEVHAPFLSPGQRRGPLQGALAALLVHRLRTLAWPAEGFRVTSPFGSRIHPVTGKKSFHNGTDLGVPTGTLLHAAHDGAVKRASVDSISGNYVILDHGLGIQTTYCHLSHIGVVEKKRVERNGVIGASGATGRVTGPHLHYILRVQETPVDAAQYGAGPAARGLQGAPTPVGPSQPSRGAGVPGTKHGAKHGTTQGTTHGTTHGTTAPKAPKVSSATKTPGTPDPTSAKATPAEEHPTAESPPTAEPEAAPVEQVPAGAPPVGSPPGAPLPPPPAQPDPVPVPSSPVGGPADWT